MVTAAQETTVTVSIAMKVNLGNYESADAFVSLSGLREGASVEEIESLLDTGKLAWSVMTERLSEKVNDLRTGSK
jgi:hypothetical protein